MKILLVSPTFFSKGRWDKFHNRLERMGIHGGDSPPLGLAYVAAGAEAAGHEVRLCDMRVENPTQDEFAAELRTYNPDVIGFYSATFNIRETVEAARFVKAKMARVIVVAGGPNVGIFPRETLAFDCFDYGFMGKADETFPRFLKSLATGSVDPSAIEGLVWRDEAGQIRTTGGPALVADLDALPVATHHVFRGKYVYFAASREPFTSMITSRGCPYNCRFCGKIPGTRKVRFRSADRVLDEMRHVARLGYREINFFDDLFTVNRERVRQICDGLLREKLNLFWSVRARVDSVDEEMLGWMKAAGCRRLYFGVESGSDRTLELMNKRITTEVAARTLAIARRLGFETVSYFIVGFPGETIDDMAQTVQFARKLSTTFASFNMFEPLPASAVHEDMRRQGPEPWADYLALRTDEIPCYHGDLARADVEEYFRRCWKAFYLQPRTWWGFLRMVNSPVRVKNFALAGLSLIAGHLLSSDLKTKS